MRPEEKMISKTEAAWPVTLNIVFYLPVF